MMALTSHNQVKDTGGKRKKKKGKSTNTTRLMGKPPTSWLETPQKDGDIKAPATNTAHPMGMSFTSWLGTPKKDSDIKAPSNTWSTVVSFGLAFSSVLHGNAHFT